MITKNMRNFIDKNKTFDVIYSEMLTPCGNPVLTLADITESDRALYRFEDSTAQILTKQDMQSAPFFKPKWKIQ